MRMPLLPWARKLQTETQGAAPTAHQEIPKALVAGSKELETEFTSGCPVIRPEPLLMRFLTGYFWVI